MKTGCKKNITKKKDIEELFLLNLSITLSICHFMKFSTKESTKVVLSCQMTLLNGK